MKVETLLDGARVIGGSKDGKVFPVRPQTAENTFLKYRIKAAWRVLAGKSDAIEWPAEGCFAQVAKEKGGV